MLPTDGLKAQANELGLRLGVCAACEPPHYAAYREWLESGSHGDMAYLADHFDLKSHPAKLLDGCRSVVCVALNYNQANPPLPGQPRIARYALGRDYHKILRRKLRRVQSALQQEHPDASFRICVDSAPLMERDFAHLAGLGWFGKNTCLIDSHRGSWFVLGFLLTTLVFEPDRPALGGCGTCRACVEACPTGAIVHEDGRWQVVGHRCISYQTIERKGSLDLDTHGWTFGCDICQEVCPFNQPRPHQPLRGQRTQESDFLARREWPNLARLAQIEREEWDTLTQGSPVRRAGLEGLRRNAQANLGR